MTSIDTALTWTLIHSLWIALFVWFITNSFSGLVKSSEKRRVLKVGGISLFSLCILAVFFYQIIPSGNTLNNNSELTTTTPALDSPVLFLTEKLDSSVALSSTIVTRIWLLGLLYGLIQLTLRYRTLDKYRSYSVACLTNIVSESFERISSQFFIRREVTVLVNSLINSPMTTGVLKPIIYLPAGMISGFSSDELDAIFIHEMTHIKRHDYLINIMLVGLETLFFFNPVVILMAKDLRKEMEFACDDSVLKRQDQLTYARVLLKLQVINIKSKTALAAKGSNSEFKERIDRIFTPGSKTMRPGLGIISMLIICTLFISSAFEFRPSGPTGNLNISIAQQDTVKRSEENTGQDTLKVREIEQGEIHKIIWPQGKDSMLYKGTTLVWAKEGKRPEQLTIRGELPVGKTVIVHTIPRKDQRMWDEIREELIKDGILHKNRPKVILMFQYSDILNGESTLKEHYQKYKDIFNRYYPVYDSFATTRAFRLEPPEQ